MKKVLLILALVAVYGIAISNVSAKVITIEKSQVTVVADADDNITPVVQDDKDKKKDKKKVKKEATTKAKTGCSETQKKSCAASGKTCGTAEKKTEAKKSCCGGK